MATDMDREFATKARTTLREPNPNARRTVVATSAADARERLLNALDEKRVAAMLASTGVTGKPNVHVAKTGVLITIFYDTDDGKGPPKPGVMPASIHMEADVLRELLCPQFAERAERIRQISLEDK